MIKAVIVDDEPQARNSLKSDLKEYCPNVELLGEAENVKTGVSLINNLNPELVFLDVEMPDGTGFDLLEKLKQIKPSLNFHLIFTTGNDAYAVKAFRFSAVDFLLKPVVADELMAAVEKAISASKRKVADESLTTLLSHIGKMDKGVKNIALATSDNIFIYKTDEIVRCESEVNYTKFYFIKDKPLLVSRTLKEFDDILVEHGFERVHKSHLVNLSHVKKFVKNDGGYLTMVDGSTVPVSQRKRERMMTILSSF